MSLGEECTMTWIIENYSLCDTRKERCLESPLFLSPRKDGDAYFLNLFSSEAGAKSEVYDSLIVGKVWNVSDSKKKIAVNVEVCNVDYEVIEAFDERKGEPREFEQNLFEGYECEVFPKVLKVEKLKKALKKSKRDVLIIRCRISTEKSTLRKNGKKFNLIAKTTTVFDKYTVNLNLKLDKFDELRVKKFTYRNGLLFEIIVKAPEDDVLIEIRRMKEQEDEGDQDEGDQDEDDQDEDDQDEDDLDEDDLDEDDLDEDDKDYKVKCQIFLLDCNKTEILSSCEFFLFDHRSPENWIWNFPSFFKKSFLMDHKLYSRSSLRFDFFISKFVPIHEDVVETEDVYPCSPSKVPESLEKDSLQDDLNAILLSNKYSDVKLRVGKEVIRAHKLILASRSPVFSAMFDQDMMENQTGEINICDISADTMKLFLKFLYTGMLEEQDCEEMLELLLAAEKYQVTSLKEKCSRFLSLHLDTDNICDVVSVADMVGHEILKETAIDYITENAAEILGSPNWPKWIKKNVEIGSEILCKVSSNFKP